MKLEHASSGPIRATSTALHLPARLPFEEWRRVGAMVARYAGASAWWIADWAAYGGGEYGRTYDHVVAATGLEEPTLRTRAWVARRFAPGRRRASVSFAHHAELAALPEPEQEAWLDRAQGERWSRRELRAQLRARRERAHPKVAAVVLRLVVSPELAERWQAAAAASGCELDEWVRLACEEKATALAALAA